MISNNAFRAVSLLIAAAGTVSGPTAAAADFESVNAPTGSYANDPAHTRFLWRIPHLGLSNYTARMNDVEIVLEFDAENPESSTVMATIDPKSVDTAYQGEEDFDAKISNNEAILNSNEHPTIEFVSRRVVQTGPDTLNVEGDLTLLGVTRPAVLEARLTGSTDSHPFARAPAMGFMASAVVDRTEFGLDFLSGEALGDEIEIEIQTEFIRK
jgi:polyisoprenoid-binding protein YceI